MTDKKNENTVELDGITYTTFNQYGCDGCAFEHNKDLCERVKIPCLSCSRDDGQSVIWLRQD